jgi:drug/metabolite transporter (DMT)-like permease
VAYIACLRFVSPLVVAVVMSSEPIASGLIAAVVHVDCLPDVWTVLGGAVMIAGCVSVVLSERERKACNMLLKQFCRMLCVFVPFWLFLF